MNSRAISICAVVGLVLGGVAECRAQPRIDLSNLVVVGDSLSAGVQNFSLLDTQQPNGYASVIAKQAGVPLTLPLIPYPGAPNVLTVAALQPIVEIVPVGGSLPKIPRDNPEVQPTNIAVPGITVSTALSLRPSPSATSGVPGWATLVLGFPNLAEGKAPTEIELATSLHPSALIEWLGNNDALVPALIGQLQTLTPLDQFAHGYQQVLDALAKTGAPIVTANIPDVTEVPYFTSARTIAAQAGLPLGLVIERLGIGPNDYVRPSAKAFVDQILTGAMSGPLPAACPTPLADLGVSSIPCVLTASDAVTVRSLVNCYNLVIAAETILHGGVMVDIHALVDQIYRKGYQIKGKNLTADFFGGLFSLDGIHPTNTGYGVIANAFIQTMNEHLGTKIPPADINAIAATDPLMEYFRPGVAAHDPSGLVSGLCFAGTSAKGIGQ